MTRPGSKQIQQQPQTKKQKAAAAAAAAKVEREKAAAMERAAAAAAASDADHAAATEVVVDALVMTPATPADPDMVGNNGLEMDPEKISEAGLEPDNDEFSLETILRNKSSTHSPGHQPSPKVSHVSWNGNLKHAMLISFHRT